MIILICVIVYCLWNIDQIYDGFVLCVNAVLGMICGVIVSFIIGIFALNINMANYPTDWYSEISSESYSVSSVDIYVNDENDGFIICDSSDEENVSYSVKLTTLERINSDDRVLIDKTVTYKPRKWEYFMFGPIPNLIKVIYGHKHVYELRYPFGKYRYVTPEILDMKDR